jgi:ribosome-binding protein aMBF1 (putative translation factor)
MPTKQDMIDKVIDYEVEVNYLTVIQAEEYALSLSYEELAQAYEDVLNNWV